MIFIEASALDNINITESLKLVIDGKWEMLKSNELANTYRKEILVKYEKSGVIYGCSGVNKSSGRYGGLVADLHSPWLVREHLGVILACLYVKIEITTQDREHNSNFWYYLRLALTQQNL